MAEEGVIPHMQRRSLLLAILALPVAGFPAHLLAAAGKVDIAAMRARWRTLLPPGFNPPEPTDTLDLGDSEWRSRLTEAQFKVLRDDGTERRFTSPLNDEKREGVYVCAGCELPLFTSEMKYDSGTGWPSFFTTIPDAIETERDYRYGWTVIEYHCRRCGGHQGHVFDDGPPPTGERWCNNGVALRFLPST